MSPDLCSPGKLAQILGFSSRKLAEDRIRGRGLPFIENTGRIFYDLRVIGQFVKLRAGQVLRGEEIGEVK
jgi:hypothetical protein